VYDEQLQFDELSDNLFQLIEDQMNQMQADYFYFHRYYEDDDD